MNGNRRICFLVFLDCIKRLIYCVAYKTCLHYFIPESNLSEYRFTDNQHKALLETLRFIYETPWTCLFKTSPFLQYHTESVNLHEMVLSTSELSFIVAWIWQANRFVHSPFPVQLNVVLMFCTLIKPLVYLFELFYLVISGSFITYKNKLHQVRNMTGIVLFD